MSDDQQIAVWEPCCPRCRRALADPAHDADQAVLGICPSHGDIQSSAAWWGEPISEDAHSAAVDQPLAISATNTRTDDLVAADAREHAALMDAYAERDLHVAAPHWSAHDGEPPQPDWMRG